MELLLIKGSIDLNDQTLLLVNICYGISLVLTSIACVIFLLNLDQLGTVQQLMSHPRRKPTVLLYSILMIFQIVLQLLVLTSINTLGPKRVDQITKSSTNTALQILVLYFSLMFYCMFVALLLRAIRSVLFALQQHGKGKIHWRYCSVVIVPTILVVLIITECYTKDKQWSPHMFDRTYVKIIVLFVMGVTVITGFTASVAILISRVLNFRNLNLSFKDALLRLSQANRLRNVFVVSIILAVLFSMNIHYSLAEFDDIQPNHVVVGSIFHLLLGFHFLVLEWWFHDKHLRTPFKWQRQKEVRRLAKRNNQTDVAYTYQRSTDNGIATIQ